MTTELFTRRYCFLKWSVFFYCVYYSYLLVKNFPNYVKFDLLKLQMYLGLILTDLKRVLSWRQFLRLIFAITVRFDMKKLN